MQNDLFDVGADFCTPVVPDLDTCCCGSTQDYVDRLEVLVRPLQRVPGAAALVHPVPGGTPGAAHLHVCRTVVRRAERSAWAAHDQHADTMNVLAITYLNRLSDLVFILARYANRERGRRAAGSGRRAVAQRPPGCPRRPVRHRPRGVEP